MAFLTTSAEIQQTTSPSMAISKELPMIIEVIAAVKKPTYIATRKPSIAASRIALSASGMASLTSGGGIPKLELKK